MNDSKQLSEAKRQLLAKYLEGRSGTGNASATPVRVIPRRTIGNCVPQSFHQEQVWTHVQMMPDKPAYNELITIHRHGPLEVGILERALDELGKRHEIWRTTFDSRDGELLQIVHDHAPGVKLELHDLRGRPKEEALQIALADAKVPFRVTELPLWRAHLVRSGDAEYQLYMNLHQLILDGVTVYGILVPELIAIYKAFEQGKPAPLAPLAIQYADYSIWQREQLSERNLLPHLAYWRRKLNGTLPVLNWPNDKARPAEQTYAGATDVFHFPSQLIDPIKKLAERDSATLFMALATGFLALLHRYTGQTDIVLGMPTANRKPETEQMMGYFLNLLAIRVDVSGNPTFRELLKRVKGTVLDALAHGDVPFHRLVREARQPRDPSRNPLFQIMISLEPQMPPIDAEWDLTQAEISSGSTKMDMYLNMDTRPDGVMAPIMYNPDLFEASTVARMFGNWKTLLEGALQNPDSPIGDLPLLTVEEQRTFDEWNANSEPVSKATVHELFEAQAARTPDAVAVRHYHETLSYDQLNRLANRVGHRLTGALGIKPGSLVEVCMERSPSLIAGLLGVLKAGLTVVPRDPNSFDSTRPACAAVVTQRHLTRRFKTVPIVEIESVASDEVDSNLEAVAAPTAYQSRHESFSHSGLTSTLTAIARRISFQPGDTLFATTSVDRDCAVLEWMLPLICGGSVVMEELPVDSTAIACHPVTVIHGTPATLRLLAGSEKVPAGFKAILVANGAALQPDLAGLLIERASTVWSWYAPRGTDLCAFVHRLAGKTGCKLLGRVVANARCRVTDANSKQLPVMTPGELRIVRDDEASQINTGLLARYRASGEIELIGSSPALVELGELEGLVLRHPSVTAARASLDSDGETALQVECTCAASEVRAFLRRRLPAVEVPNCITTLGGAQRIVARADAGTAPVAVVAIQAGGGDSSPFYYLCAEDEPDSVIETLAGSLGTSRPVLKVKLSDGACDLLRPPYTMAKAAQLAADAIRTYGVQDGYHVGGAGFGGLLAYETARILGASGKTASSVVRLGSPRIAREETRGLGSTLRSFLKGKRLTRMSEILSAAASDYRPEPLSVPVALFCSASDEPSTARLENVEIHKMPCAPDQLLREPMVHRLAIELEQYLNEPTLMTPGGKP